MNTVQKYNKLLKALKSLVKKKEYSEFTVDKVDPTMCNIFLDGYFFSNIHVDGDRIGISFELSSPIDICLYFFKQVCLLEPTISIYEPTYFSIENEDTYFGDEAYGAYFEDLRKDFEKEKAESVNVGRFDVRH